MKDQIKKIHIYYINKIKNLDMKIFEYEDDDCPNRRGVAKCEKEIERCLDNAGITEGELRREVRGACSWCDDNCVKKLKDKGWEILIGKETFNEKV